MLFFVSTAAFLCVAALVRAAEPAACVTAYRPITDGKTTSGRVWRKVCDALQSKSGPSREGEAYYQCRDYAGPLAKYKDGIIAVYAPCAQLLKQSNYIACTGPKDEKCFAIKCQDACDWKPPAGTIPEQLTFFAIKTGDEGGF